MIIKMKKYTLQIIGLISSMLGYMYFVIIPSLGIFLDKTEYDRFYLDTLQKPFMIVNGVFIVLFILSFFFKKYTKYLLLLLVISFIAMYLVDFYYWSTLNHGQGG